MTKKVLTPIQDFLKRLKSVAKRVNSVGVDFNELTKEAVQIVWNPDIQDISGINKCLAVAKASRGFSEVALLKFFKECVPFTYSQEHGQFTKKNGQTVDKMIGTWETFLEGNNWYDYVPDKVEKEYSFKPDAIVSQVVKKLDEAHDHDVLTLSNLLALQTALNKAIDDKLSFESDMDEVDAELTELLKQDDSPVQLAAAS